MAAKAEGRSRPTRLLGKRPSWFVSRLFLYVAVLLMFVWSATPFLYMFSISLMDTSEVVSAPPKWFPWPPKLAEWRMVVFGAEQRAEWYGEEGEKVGTEYEAAKTGGDVAKGTITHRIPKAVLRSFIVALGATFLNLLIGSFAGYAMARYPQFWFTDATLNVLMITRMLPGLALLIPFFMVYRTTGLLNTLHGLIIAYTSFILPLTVWVMRGYFASVPKSLEWSAQVDGCNWLQAFWRIFLPVSAPGLVAAAIFTFLVSWNEFLFALILVPRAEVQTAPLAVAALITPGANVLHDYTALYVAGTLAVVPPVLIAFIFQRYLIQGMLAGAIKG